MVFANLDAAEKAAFFVLLDEYFSTRPELAQALGLPGGGGGGGALLGAAQRAAAAHPRAASAAVSAGMARAKPGENADIASAVGRVAAASRAFGAPAPPPSRTPSAGGPLPSTSDVRPPPPPRRSTSRSAHDPPPGVVSQRKLGDLDTSSTKNMFWGMRGAEGAPPPAAPVPAALPRALPKVAPPPVRRAVARAPTPEPEPEPEPEEAGEWAEALYDYASADPNDLPLTEGARVRVTARTSDDWWTGEVDGKSGLFPAAYVKLL